MVCHVSWLLLVTAVLGALVHNASPTEGGTDYYVVLGVERSATTREIRRAFKKLALQKHPDKNPHDPNAHNVFVGINTAFEVLKDPELRKKYDMFGEEGLKEENNRGHEYQGWNYYEQDFGLYDEDVQIETFASMDFFGRVLQSDEVWFVNFYSPGCSHCHDLAPDWRELGLVLRGVIGVGAVNCQDAWGICNEMGIQAFPTLMMFSKPGTWKRYQGRRQLDQLVAWAMSQFPRVQSLSQSQRGAIGQAEHGAAVTEPLLVVICVPALADCVSRNDLKMFSLASHGLLETRTLDCLQHSDFCSQLGLTNPQVRLYAPGHQPTVLFPLGSDANLEWDDVFSSKRIAAIVEAGVDLLPGPPVLEPNQLEQVVKDHHLQLTTIQDLVPAAPSTVTGLLVFFFDNTLNESREASRILKRIKMQDLPLAVVAVDCGHNSDLCYRSRANHAPMLMLFRVDGYEAYHGDFEPQAIREWAEIGLESTVMTLTMGDFPAIFDGSPLFLDFFTPWCPPCRAMLPVFRKASAQMAGTVRFGTIDCTTEMQLCNKMQVQAYPFVVYYKGDGDRTPHVFDGDPTDPNAFDEHVKDVLHPPVQTLDPEGFDAVVQQSDLPVMVDFFAPWCGPCRRLAPEFKAAAKLVGPLATFASVDCEEFSSFCEQQGIQSYPTVRYYQARKHNGRAGKRPFKLYRGHRFAHPMASVVFQSLPNKVKVLTQQLFEDEVGWTNDVWLINFGAPWCGPCRQFLPVFNSIAHSLSHKFDVLKFGKIDCERYGRLCHELGLPHYPFLVLFVDGEHLFQESQEPPVIQAWVERALESRGYASPAVAARDEL
eukprot:m.258373 g.258373  ORF g.258373 m.258373 type:complete len:823 (+) comp19190_c0_seq1:1143-3611(+)